MLSRCNDFLVFCISRIHRVMNIHKLSGIKGIRNLFDPLNPWSLLLNEYSIFGTRNCKNIISTLSLIHHNRGHYHEKQPKKFILHVPQNVCSIHFTFPYPHTPKICTPLKENQVIRMPLLAQNIHIFPPSVKNINC
jgi:hypothetical protein